MIYIISFFIGFTFNDARIIYKIFGQKNEFIKYRLVIRELGLVPYLCCVLLNYFKGFFPLLLSSEGDFIRTLIALSLLVGNYLGSKPGKTGGSELIVLWGIWSGISFDLVQTPLALFFGILLITSKYKISFLISSILVNINLLLINNYFMSSLSYLILLNYVISEWSHFSPIINKLKEKLILKKLKGVKTL